MDWWRLWAVAGPLCGLIAGILIMSWITAGVIEDAYTAGVRAGLRAGEHECPGSERGCLLPPTDASVRPPDDQDFIGGWV